MAGIWIDWLERLPRHERLRRHRAFRQAVDNFVAEKRVRLTRSRCPTLAAPPVTSDGALLAEVTMRVYEAFESEADPAFEHPSEIAIRVPSC